jgi:hypothetical protein
MEVVSVVLRSVAGVMMRPMAVPVLRRYAAMVF